MYRLQIVRWLHLRPSAVVCYQQIFSVWTEYKEAGVISTVVFFFNFWSTVVPAPIHLLLLLLILTFQSPMVTIQTTYFNIH